MSTRRRFLTLIGAAPVAVPVAAKEAAVAMGLSGPVGPASIIEGSMLKNAPMAGGIAADMSWTTRALERLMSEDGRREVSNDAKAYARTLDPDLAALRSVSPSFAFRRQRDRNEIHIMEHRRSELLREISEHAKRNLLG